MFISLGLGFLTLIALNIWILVTTSDQIFQEDNCPLPKGGLSTRPLDLRPQV